MLVGGQKHVVAGLKIEAAGGEVECMRGVAGKGDGLGSGANKARDGGARDLDAIHLRDEGLERLEDSDILEKARNEERILLAHDLDFGALLATAGTQLPSVITFRLRNMHPDSVNHHLKEVLTHNKKSLEQGAIISVVEGWIRVRSLPLKR